MNVQTQKFQVVWSLRRHLPEILEIEKLSFSSPWSEEAEESA